MSIRKKYILYFSIVFLLIELTLSYFLTQAHLESLIRAKTDAFTSTASALSANFSSPLFTLDKIPEDRIILRDQLGEALAGAESGRESGLAGAFLADKSGRFVAGKFSNEALRAWFGFEEDGLMDAPLVAGFPTGDGVATEKIAIGARDFGVIFKPVLFRAKDQAHKAGYLAIVFDYDGIHRARREALLIAGGGVAVATLLSVLFIALVTSILIRRIKAVAAAVHGVAEGRFEKVTPQGSDEIGLLMRAVNHMIDSVRERLELSKYVSDATLEFVKNGNGDGDRQGERLEAAIMISDIRNFTAFAGTNDHELVVDMLNRMLDLQAETVREFEGDVDKFVGDQVVAVFTGDGMERRAIAAAGEIQRRIKAETGLLEVGIGIEAGEVVRGPIGGKDRLDGTVIGDAVNMAARFCGLAEPGEIIIGEGLLEHAEGTACHGPRCVSVKGKIDSLRVYAVAS